VSSEPIVPGEITVADGWIALNPGRPRVTIEVVNTGDRPVQVGSHFHFFETNTALSFDRSIGYGCHLDIPAGTAVRFEPGAPRRVVLVPFGGERIAAGFRGMVAGVLDG
jgi:urease beta subunit